jgi:hypothetical protein
MAEMEKDRCERGKMAEKGLTRNPEIGYTN